jgi:hypothetical protein
MMAPRNHDFHVRFHMRKNLPFPGPARVQRAFSCHFLRAPAAAATAFDMQQSLALA